MLGHLTTRCCRTPPRSARDRLAAPVSPRAPCQHRPRWSSGSVDRRASSRWSRASAADVLRRAQLRRGHRTPRSTSASTTAATSSLTTEREASTPITSDPLDPWVKGAAALYTREFWQLGQARLEARRRRHGVRAALREHRRRGAQRARDVPRGVFPNGARVRQHRQRHSATTWCSSAATATSRSISKRLARRLDERDYERVAASLHEVGFESELDLKEHVCGGCRVSGAVARRRSAQHRS